MLERSARHASSDFSETQAFLSAKGLSSRATGGDACAIDRRFDAKINALYSDGFYLAWMEYGADVEIDAPAERADYGFSIPYGGAMASTGGAGTGGEMLACTRRRTVLASPGRPQRMFLAGDAKRLALSVDQALVRRRLACLTGEAVAGVVEFEPLLTIAEGPGRVIASHMELVAAEEDGGGDVFADALRRAHFEETLLTTLLLHQPHSHRWLLERPAAAPASRDVKRALDLIHASLETPLRLEDLVAAAGAPGRSLNQHFRAFTGFAPMAYLRRARLAAVRRALLSGDEPSVTAAATRFGFGHLGRFSGVYRAAFGEAPSSTLARGRRARRG